MSILLAGAASGGPLRRKHLVHLACRAAAFGALLAAAVIAPWRPLVAGISGWAWHHAAPKAQELIINTALLMVVLAFFIMGLVMTFYAERKWPAVEPFQGAFWWWPCANALPAVAAAGLLTRAGGLSPAVFRALAVIWALCALGAALFKVYEAVEKRPALRARIARVSARAALTAALWFATVVFGRLLSVAGLIARARDHTYRDELADYLFREVHSLLAVALVLMAGACIAVAVDRHGGGGFQWWSLSAAPAALFIAYYLEWAGTLSSQFLNILAALAALSAAVALYDWAAGRLFPRLAAARR
jgi:uncharacterized membrane protein